MNNTNNTMITEVTENTGDFIQQNSQGLDP